MAEMFSPDESTPGSFKLAEVDRQDAARLAMVLDLVAAKPAVQLLKAWATALVHPADTDVLDRMVAFFLAQTANPYSGRTLRALVADAGLTTVDETAATWIEPQSGASKGFLGMMGTASAAAGVITPAEADAFNHGLAEAAERGAFHMSLTMYAVAGTKPVPA